MEQFLLELASLNPEQQANLLEEARTLHYQVLSERLRLLSPSEIYSFLVRAPSVIRGEEPSVSLTSQIEHCDRCTCSWTDDCACFRFCDHFIGQKEELETELRQIESERLRYYSLHCMSLSPRCFESVFRFTSGKPE